MISKVFTKALLNSVQKNLWTKKAIVGTMNAAFKIKRKKK